MTSPLDVGRYTSVLNNGSYVTACKAPVTMAVDVCTAIQNGVAVGVTVTTTPRNPEIEACIAGRVRSRKFEPRPDLEIARTKFAGKQEGEELRPAGRSHARCRRRSPMGFRSELEPDEV